MSIDKNKKAYDEWSLFYDDAPNSTVAIDDLTFPKVYSNKIGNNILEIGCGTGRHTKRLVQRGRKVTAIDISPGMMEQARKKIRKKSVTFVEGDFITTPIPNSPFDLAIMSLVLEHMPLQSFFQKTRNLLKTQGILCFSEIHPERSAQGRMAHFKAAHGGEVQLSGCPHTEKEIIAAAKESSFAVESCQTIKGHQELTQKNETWAKYVNKPMIQIWTLVAIDDSLDEEST